MAARYWIGGTGNWNDTAHWSATSGGVGGASVPTMDDDVYFDSNSGTGTVTVNAIANMRDCTFAQTQLITLTNAAYAFNIYGNWTLCSNTYLATSFTGTGYVYLKATTSVNITSNGCTRSWNRLHFDGIGGEFVLIDNCVLNSYLLRGTLNVNGNKLTGFIRNDGGSPTQSGFNLDNSSFEGSLFFNATAELFFFSAINSIVDITNYCRAPKNTRFNIINYKSNSYNTADGNIDGLKYIDVLNIYSASNTISVTYITNDFEVRLLNIFGTNSTNYRALFSSHFGTPRTITCNGTITASNVDFRDIIGAGTANWDLSAIEGGSGDCGGNSGITFTPAQTQYHRRPSAGGSNWSTPGLWFTESGDVGRVPLPQDDVVFDENSFPIGNNALYINVVRLGRNINMTKLDKTVSLTIATNIDVYGDFILSNNLIINSINKDIGFYGYDIHQIYIPEGDVQMKVFNNISIYRGSYILINNINWWYGFGFYSNGFLDANDFNMNCIGINVGGGSVLASGTIYMGNGFWNYFDKRFEITNATVYCEESTIVMETKTEFTAYSYIKANNRTLNTVIFKSSPYSSSISEGVTINNIIVEKNKKVLFRFNYTYNINKLTAIGTPDQPITIGSTTPGSKYTLNITGTEPIETDYINITDCNVTQTNKFYAGKNSTNGGNNTNIIFDYVKLPLNMNLYTLKMYDKVLTDDEVLQNYNATKNRYL